MSKPRLLDLFCGAGGATRGYQDAGFYVVGVDIEGQPNYCGDRFVRADALRPLHQWLCLSDFDLIHASPPCQAYSASTVMWRDRVYPNLVPPTRSMLATSGVPYVIENVPGAPLGYSITLCGSTMGLPRIRRHRHFETSWPMMSPGCNHSLLREPLSVTGHGEHGSGVKNRTLPYGLEARKEAMGIDWMTRDELSEAIPPAYTQFIGEQFLAQRLVGVEEGL